MRVRQIKWTEGSILQQSVKHGLIVLQPDPLARCLSIVSLLRSSSCHRNSFDDFAFANNRCTWEAIGKIPNDLYGPTYGLATLI
jgi:hypothetical protein